MHLRRLMLLGAGLAALAAGSARACPQHSTSKSAVSAPARRSGASALVAWKPRAWSPLVPGTTVAQGLRVSIDPVDGAYSMPAVEESARSMSTDEDAPVAVV